MSQLANGLVPTTWFAPAASVYGKIVDGLDYKFQISTSLEDFGDSFEARSEGGKVPPIGTPYEAGINGHEALALAKSPTGDFAQLSNDIAYAFRLSYNPSFLPGFAGSTSVYFTPNTTPRGAHSDLGTTLGRSNLTLFDTEFRYRVPETGWEFRAEYARAFIGNPANLRANNDSDPENNVGRAMYGFSGEVAYHQRLGRALGTEWWAVPFYRYTYENFQMGGFEGTDSNNPNGSGTMQFHTVGAAVFPTPKLVLKLDYQKVIDNTSHGARSDSVLGGVGFYFYSSDSRTWQRWTAPPAIVLSMAAPAYASQYLSVEAAQRLAFPSATQFVAAHVVYRPADVAAIEKLSGQKVRTRGEQVWRALAGDQLLGFFVVDYVIGKHLVIDYAVALGPEGRVQRVEILEYRESYGSEISNHAWLAQFVGKTLNDPLEVDRDIRNISGATLSSHHVTEGVKRVLAIYATCLR